jgi:hypothetical protein
VGLIDDVEGKGDDEHEPPASGSKKAAAPAAKRQHRDNLIIILVGVLGVIVTFLVYRKNQEASTTTTGTSAPATSTGTVAGGSSASDPYADSMVEQLQGEQDASTSAIQGLQTMIGNLGSELSELGSGPSASSNPATQTPTYSWAITGINAADFPQTVSAAQLSANPTGYTALGYYGGPGATDFQGAGVSGGAPVYANIFGGLAQGDSQGFSQVPAGTELYTPSQYAGNITGTPAYAGASAHTL